MNDQEWKVLISAHFDGALSSEDAEKAGQLLVEKAECRAYLAELKKLSLSLHVVKDETLSPDAELKILSKTTKERLMKPVYWKSSAAVAATVLVVVLAYTNTYVHRGVQGRLKSATDDIGIQRSQRSTALSVVHLGKSGGPLLQEMQAARSDRSNYYYDAEAQYEPYYSKSSQVDLSASPSGMESFSGVAASHQYVQSGEANTEEYTKVNDNKFMVVTNEPLSTFSVDVDTASYSNLRRYLTQNQMPPKDAVRIEEMVNYFTYAYPQPKAGEPFSVTADLAVCPWNTGHQLVRIGLKGKTPDAANLPASNLVFLIDVSGSMQDQNKLPLLKEGFKMMVRNLRSEDKVSIVTYAGSAGKVLDPTSGAEKDKIIAAIDSMQSGGSTAGGEGIRLAYELAKAQFIKGGNNRVILATDGDFNVGVSSTSDMERLIEDKRKDGIFLTVLGFGQGNVKDGRMETIADKGNGNYYYIDNLKEARKVLVTELGSTLFTIAKDVKIQVEFNPANVKAYRLIGYENRMLAKEDFNDDKKDAGEIGAGHTVTALYEIVPAGSTESFGSVDALKYQQASAVQPVASDEVLTVKLRYKEPDGDVSKLITKPVLKAEIKNEPVGDFAWAGAVAEFGMLLRGSEFKGSSTYEQVLKAARANLGEDKFGFRAEFVTLVENAGNIAPTQENGQINFK